MESALVIKVKCREVLRRFTVFADENGFLDLDMRGLKEKIHSFFKFAPGTDLSLTYIDEENDLVALVDDDDLCEAYSQCLNPLRINVVLNSTRLKRSKFRLNKSYNPKGIPRVSHDPAVAEGVLKFLQEQMLDAFSKLSNELRPKITSLLLTKLADCLSKLELTHLNPVLKCQDGQNGERNGEEIPSKCSGAPEVTEDLKYSKEKSEAKVLSSGKVEEQIQETFQKESSNVNGDLGISTPMTTSMLDNNADLAEGSAASGYSNQNIPSSVSPPDDDRKKAQKDVGVHLMESAINFNSLFPTSLTTPANMQASEATVPRSLESCIINGDDQITPCGNKQCSDSHFVSKSCEITCNNGHIGVDSCKVDSIWHDCVYPFKEGFCSGDTVHRVFHKGIRCDGCGVHPIVGPRFKSKVAEDYDLCSTCFSDLGNEAEYTRLDQPVSWLTKRFNDPHPLAKPFSSLCARGRDTTPYPRRFDSYLVKNVSIVDGTLMAPNVPFTKIWKMRNTGASAWPFGTRLVWIGGDQFTDLVAVEVEIPTNGFPMGKDLDIAVDLIAPENSGRYISHWRMSLPSGKKFGQRISIHIEVDASLKGPADTSHEFNLNLPPENCRGEGEDSIDLNAEIVKGSMPLNGKSKVAAEALKPKATINKWRNMDQKLHLPGFNGLITRNGVSDPSISKGFILLSDPELDLSGFPSKPSPFNPQVL